MGIDFQSGNDDFYSLNFVMPDSDWCIPFWINLTNGLSGNFYQYLYSVNSWFSTPSIQIHIPEDGNGNTGKMEARPVDDGGDTAYLIGDRDANLDDGNWWLTVFQRNGSNFEIWECAFKGTANQIHSISVGSVDAFASQNMRIGGREDDQGDRGYENWGDHWGFFHDAATQVQIELGASGVPFHMILSSPQIYYQFKSNPTTMPTLFGTETASKTGTPAVVESAPVWTPAPVGLVTTAAPAVPSTRRRMILTL